MKILSMNLKGGASKSTNASIIASFLPHTTIYEFDRINETAEKIKTKHYKSEQIDFNNSDSVSFINFENKLIDCKDDENMIIDVGAIKLADFFKAFSITRLFSEIDLLIIPMMDGADDYRVAYKMLSALKRDGLLPEKILFALSRFNEEEYDIKEYQFTTLFKNKKLLKKEFNIDIDKQSFTINDSRAIKYANENGISIRDLVEEDFDKLLKLSRERGISAEERFERSLKRNVVDKSKRLLKYSITPMLEKISNYMNNDKKGE